MNHRLLALCLSLTLGGATAAHAGLFDGLSNLVGNASSKEAPAYDPAAAPETLIEDYIEIETEEAGILKGVKRVAITQFQVEFMTEISANAFAKGSYGSSSTNANVYVNAKLEGVGTNEFQRLTDRYYDGLVTSLKAAGIEVVDPARVSDHPEFKEMMSGAKPAPLEEDATAGKGTFVTAQGLPVWFEPEESFIRKGFSISFGKKEEKDPYQSFGSKMGMMFTGKATAVHEPALLKSLDATGLRVRLTVPFMQIKKSTSGFGAKVESRGSVQVEKWVSRLSFVTPDNQRARIRLKKPMLAAASVGEMVDVTTTGEKAMDAAANVLAVATSLMGGPVKGTMQSGTSYALRTDPQQYVSVVGDQFDAAQKLFSAALSKARQ